jgi:thioester reductase-like protein
VSSPHCGRLIPDVIIEPLWNQWYAWSYLIPPATAARYLTESQVPVMQSFIDAPKVHEDALRDPAMAGGPFIQHSPDRVDEVAALLAATRRDQGHLFALSNAIDRLEALLDSHPRGESLEPLYSQVPSALRGFVELVYDARDCPSIRFIEALLYRSDFYRTSSQSIALRRLPDVDRRAFVMSTPRLERDLDCRLPLHFADPRIDALSRLRFAPGPVGEMAEQLGLAGREREAFLGLFTDGPLPQPQPIDGDEVHVRYLGHACVMVQTRDVSVLCDPLIGYAHPTGMPRLSYTDLPEQIDFALITHNHQDHVMFETLLQLRHKIGTLVVARGQKGSLLDPSLRLTLRQIGFDDVREIDELERIEIPGGEIIGLPVLGEHGDLNIATKTAYWISVKGRSILCAADSNNLDNRLYENLHRVLGEPDILFIGMESDGAPYSWSYGPLLPGTVPHRQAQSRRLDGSNAERGLRLVDTLKPHQVYVYAMGMEPWLNFITSIHYTPASQPIIESDNLVAACRTRGIASERMLGCRKFILRPALGTTARRTTQPLPIATDAFTAEPVTRTARPAADRGTPAADDHPPGIATGARAGELTEFLKRLRALDVRLWLDAGRLRCSAPKGALSAELTAALKQYKPQIINLLQGRGDDTEADGKAGGDEPRGQAIWRDDLALAADILPGTAGAAGRDTVKAILLTGATGFLGAYLLAELLRQTAARIHCLVRAESAPAAASRLRRTLLSFGLWRGHFADRIEPLCGNLADTRLGLGEDGFAHLAADVDLIVHNGAQVHHGLPYAQLRATNVSGTREILRLACLKGRSTPLHYVSTLSVLPAAATTERARFFERDEISVYPAPQGGYNLSKWVAEHLVAEARRRGLPVTVYRPGPISGDSRNGRYNSNDFLFRLMSGYVQSGLAPDGATLLDLLPVDFVARTIVSLSRGDQAAGHTYHLLHPRPVSSEILFDVCRDAGLDIRRVPYEDWFRHLGKVAREDKGHALFPLAALFSSRRGRQGSAEGSAALPFDSSDAQAAMRTAGLEPPRLDKTLFATYLSALLKALPEPKGGATAPTAMGMHP